MTRRTAPVLAAVVAVLTTLLVGPAAPARVVEPTGTVTGRVLALGDDTWRTVTPRVTAWRRVGGQWRSLESTAAASDGRYSISDLPVGTYRIMFDQFVVDAPRDSATIYFDGAETLEEATDVVVGPGAVHRGVDATFDLGSVIAGRVTDAQGRGVAQVRVGRRTFDGTGPASAYLTASTDRLGRYEVRGLSAGAYRMFFVPRDHVHADRVWPQAATDHEEQAVDIVIGDHQSVDGIDVVLPSGGALGGTLEVPDVDAALYNYAVVHRRVAGLWTELETRYVGQTGYLFGGLAADSYRVCFRPFEGGPLTTCLGGSDVDSAADVPVTAGRTVRRDHTGVPLAAVAGSVLDTSGAPASGVTVTALRRTPHGFQESSATTTDATGNYRLAGLSADAYRLRFASEATQEFWPDADSVDDAPDVRLVAGQEVVDLDSVLDAGAEISGVFLDDDGDATQAPITAYRLGADGTWVPVPSDVSLDGVGGFRVTGLRPGTYRLGFGANRQWTSHTVPVFWPDAPRLDEAADISVPTLTSRVDGIDVDVAPGSTIVGSVLRFGRDRHRSSDIVAYRSVDGGWVEEARGSTTWRLDDRFALAGLPAGTYRVAVEPDDVFWARTFHGPAVPRSLAGAADVTVGRGEVVEDVDVVLAAQVRNPMPGRVVGRARVGSVLRVAAGTWSPTGVRLEHQWLRDGRSVRGATGVTYRLRPRDRTARMSVRVSGRRGPGWFDLTIRTPSTRPVGSR